MKWPRRDLKGEAGFTLLETLIAMTLMVGIVAVLATITSQWLPNWNRGFARVQQAELLGRGLERLVADLSAAEFVTANRTTKQPMFEGNELSVLFVRSAIGPNTRPGLEIVRIAATADQRGPALVRSRTPFGLLAENAKISDLSTFSDPVVLMRAPYRVIFAYAGSDYVWRNSWRDADQLPTAIRVSVRDAASERSLAVSTATVLHVDAPAECAAAKDPKNCVSPSPPPNGSGDAKTL
jgi:general secretion pathway protein J